MVRHYERIFKRRVYETAYIQRMIICSHADGGGIGNEHQDSKIFSFSTKNAVVAGLLALQRTMRESPALIVFPSATLSRLMPEALAWQA